MSRPAPTAAPAESRYVHIPSRWASHLVITVMVAAFVTGIIGTALSPTLVVDHPLVMVALNANNRYLILVTNDLGSFGFYTVAILRRVIPSIAFFLLGRWYGRRAVKWLAGREPASTDVVSVVQRLFDRFGWGIVALAPMTFTCLLAGAARLRPKVVVPVVAVSIAVRLVLIRWLGSEFSGTLDSVVDWIDRSRGTLMVVTVGLVLITAWSQRKRRSESFSELTSLEDEVAESAAD
jgi:membrane protein DedA with SNARE-associated domain